MMLILISSIYSAVLNCRRWVPELANYPDRFLFEPWRAPRAVQEKAKCIVGKDYPETVVEHKAASASNTEKMKSIAQFLQEQNVGECWEVGGR